MVGDPKAKGYNFKLAVVITARQSGFTLLAEVPENADDETVARWLVDLARKHRYVWRDDQFRKWASEAAANS